VTCLLVGLQSNHFFPRGLEPSRRPNQAREMCNAAAPPSAPVHQSKARFQLVRLLAIMSGGRPITLANF
jgi:hypothetical protein